MLSVEGINCNSGNGVGVESGVGGAVGIGVPGTVTGREGGSFLLESLLVLVGAGEVEGERSSHERIKKKLHAPMAKMSCSASEHGVALLRYYCA